MELDVGLLSEFERCLDPRHPERGRIPTWVLGYGEISTVLEIGGDAGRALAYKRMPIFRSAEEIEGYKRTLDTYCRVLSEEVGIALPASGHASLEVEGGRRVLFIGQEKLKPASVGHKAIHLLPPGDTVRLVRAVLRELRKVWEFNAGGAGVELGIDGQISNWAVDGFDPDMARLPEDPRLVYFDISTPLVRLEGVEQLDPELFLRSAPSFLVWLLRLFFLKGVVERYYDFHLVAVDLVANFYKEQLPGLIPRLVAEVNDFFAGEAGDLKVAPITPKEVKSYYRQDALIWRLYLSMRRTDRFLKTRILRTGYPYILPGKVNR
ncbi:MAG: DUF6206 family protein [Actinomycetota bacterium]